MTLTIQEGFAMVQAAQYYKRIVQNGSQQRSWPDEKFRRACEYVRSERIGDIRTVRVGLPGVNYLDRAKPARAPDSQPPPSWTMTCGSVLPLATLQSEPGPLPVPVLLGLRAAR
jgi:predicted dehydrogenase